MRKTPSYLKGLAETRARVSAEVARYTKLLAEISQELATAQAELEACDRLIRKYDVRLNPELIEPIKAWKGRYGPRGKLKETIIRLLSEHRLEPLTTRELVYKLQYELQVTFTTFSEKARWQHNSVVKQLKVFVSEGLVERIPDQTLRDEDFLRWRWLGEGCESLEDLVALAESSGVATRSEVELYVSEEALDADDLPV